MEQEDVTPQNLVNHLRSVIDKLEQQMAAMVASGHTKGSGYAGRI